MLAMNFYIPKDKDFDKLAVILPGFLDSKDYDHLVELGKFLAEKNYLGVSFNPTGTWKNTENTGKYSISQYLLDIDEAILTAKEKFKQDFSEIIILGHSLGGKVALIYASRNKNIKMVVGIMPPNQQDWSKWKDNGLRVSVRNQPKNIIKLVSFKIPFSFVEDSLKYDLIEALSKIDCPILFIAGELDDVVLPEIVESIYQKAKEPKKYILIKGIGHNYRLFKDQIKKVNDEIGKFIFGT